MIISRRSLLGNVKAIEGHVYFTTPQEANFSYKNNKLHIRISLVYPATNKSDLITD